ncbi:MAG: hypothetical protein L0H75_03245 [Nitrosospira sp.]|nr:hypothetical protein [Nitrosospira sp.]
MERLYQFPAQAKHYHCFTQDMAIKEHPAYRAAKSGNPAAALDLVEELAWDFLQSLGGLFPNGMKYVSPYAREATGDNAIPLLLSISCARLLNGQNETDIVQMQRVFHTGADPMERLLLRPSFEGQVEEGASYVLVDDVTSMGGTLAELANFIRINGGRVIGSIMLVNAGRTKSFTPPGKHTSLLEERFGNGIKEIFGIHPKALTANEAGYLAGFRTLDEIRNRCIKAEKETNLRLLSKGIGK